MVGGGVDFLTNDGLRTIIEPKLKEFFDDGLTRFLDEHNRPILYGTELADTIFAEQAADFPYFAAQDYMQNGVVIISGDKNDTIHESQFDDEFHGGDGFGTLEDEPAVVDQKGLSIEFSAAFGQNSDGVTERIIAIDVVEDGFGGTDKLFSIEQINSTSQSQF